MQGITFVKHKDLLSKTSTQEEKNIMLSNELKSKINRLWDKFWSRGISNPVDAISQISYLLFMRRLDDTDAVDKAKATFAGKGFNSIFKGQEDCRWSFFSRLEPETMLQTVTEKAFPFIKHINDHFEPYAKSMSNAVFIVNNASLLFEAVNAIDDIYADIKKQQQEGQQFQDTLGDVYEYLLSEMSTAGMNGQFRTPRHLIQFMCELLDPDWTDKICDPACGTGGFLIGAYQHILTKYSSPEEITEDENGFKRFKKYGGDKIAKKEVWDTLHEKAFYGFDMDQTMVRIGLMNLILHGITVPKIENIDSLSKVYDQTNGKDNYSIVLANPPFTGKIDKGGMSDQLKIGGTNTELLFLVRISQMLRPNGKAAVIIPEGVLFGTSKNKKATREILLKDNQLEAVISLPSGAFKPYTNVKTAILVFTKANHYSSSWQTEKVWFYQLKNDGYSLDDSRRKLTENPLPVAVEAFKHRDDQTPTERKNYFYVPINEIRENGLELRYNRYKEFEYVEQQHEPPKKILELLMTLEREIQQDLEELKNLLG